MNKPAKKIICIFLSFFILIFCLLWDICTGTTSLSFNEMLYALLNKDVGTKATLIIWKIRLPSAVMAINVGIALGLSGACMQTLLNNSLASPYTLGVSAGAGFGAALALVTGWFSGTVLSGYISSIFAIAAAMFVSCLICLLSKRKHFSRNSMVLAGIALMFLFQSLQSFLQFIADSDTMQGIIFWNLGSLEKADWNKVLIITILNLLLVPILFTEVWNLTALKLGDIEAKTIGVNVEKTRLKCFSCICVITAVSVSFVGSIGFIGIAAPHIARRLLGDEQRYYMVFSGMIGAVLLSTASVLSKLIIPGIIFPIGIITSMIGVPFFAFIIFKGDLRDD